MTPQAVNAIALLIGEALKAGITISGLLQEARANGAISDETWANILLDLDQAEELWHGTPGG